MATARTTLTDGGIPANHAQLMGQLIAQAQSTAAQLSLLAAQVTELTKQVSMLAIAQATAQVENEAQRELIKDLTGRMGGSEQRERDDQRSELNQHFLSRQNAWSITVMLLVGFLSALATFAASGHLR